MVSFLILFLVLFCLECTLGSFLAFQAMVSIATIGLYIAYALPTFFMETLARKSFIPGPFSLGCWGILVRSLGGNHKSSIFIACILSNNKRYLQLHPGCCWGSPLAHLLIMALQCKELVQGTHDQHRKLKKKTS